MATITINTDQLSEVGENLKAILVDGKLVLITEVDKSIGPSSSGKMDGVCSTGGFAPLPGGLKGNVYIGKKC